MEVITIESDAYKQLMNKIDELLERIEGFEKNQEDKLLTNEEIMELLGISKRTAQNYRDQGLISFSKHGKKIHYKMSDVQTFLENNKIKAFKKKR